LTQRCSLIHEVVDTFTFVADTIDYVASVYGAKATWSTLSTFNKVDRVELNFIASVYRALEDAMANGRHFKDR